MKRVKEGKVYCVYMHINKAHVPLLRRKNLYGMDNLIEYIRNQF